MKATLPDGTLIEGTPEEVTAVLRSLQAVAEPSAEMPFRSKPPMENTEELSPAEVRHIFTRRPLSENQAEVLELILGGGKQGIRYSKLGSHLDLNKHQMAGLFGALGRRVANTYKDREVSLWGDILVSEDIWEGNTYDYFVRIPEKFRDSIKAALILS